jgi:hypothetical protein
MEAMSLMRDWASAAVAAVSAANTITTGPIRAGAKRAARRFDIEGNPDCDRKRDARIMPN